jgi:hypothetical protein
VPAPVDFNNGPATGIVLPADFSPLVDIDMFNPEANSDMPFGWAGNLPALESLPHLPLDRNTALLFSHCGFEEELSPADLNTMQRYYFDHIYFSFPFLNKDRFLAESAGGDNAIKALIYSVALTGCAQSPAYRSKKAKCYELARDYAERSERGGQMDDLNLLQALLFIGRVEAMNGELERSWLTLGRAAMLSRLLKLHQIDRSEETEVVHAAMYQSAPGLNLPASTEPVALEEWRRTFWALYILQSYLRTRTGWQCILGDEEVRHHALLLNRFPCTEHLNHRTSTFAFRQQDS